MSNKLFSSIGTITKQEEITTADHIKDSSIMIFETRHPYYGYYGTTVPGNPDASSFFLVTRFQHNDEGIFRAIQEVRKSFDHYFDAVPGHISFSNKLYGVIRVRCLDESKIPALVDALGKKGMEFIAPGKQSPVNALIHVTKFFETEEIDDGIYADLHHENFAYLRVNKKPDWNRFVEITKHVRNNVGGISFDAAQATLYDRDGVADFVRVYTEKRSANDLKTIRNRYLESEK